MQKLRKTKGFTLTELAIVIAVIAILIAVLVPTFTSLINKANESVDMQAAKNLNTSLSTGSAADSPQNIGEVIDILVADGYAENVTPYSSDYVYKWDKTQNVIVLYDTKEEKVLYPTTYEYTADSISSLYNLSYNASEFGGFAYGDGTEESPYEIATLEHLESLRTLIDNDKTSGVYFELTRDLDLGSTWVPLGNTDFEVTTPGSASVNSQYSDKFYGTFEGNGKTITMEDSTTIDEDWDYALFSYVAAGATIQNLNVDMNVVNGTNYSTGAIASYVSGSSPDSITFKNITVTGTITATTQAGGIVGWSAQGCNFINCVNYANITTYSGSLNKAGTIAYSNIGGISAQAGAWFYATGTNNGSVEFTNCANYGTLTHCCKDTDNVDYYSMIGNIVGQLATSNTTSGETGTLTFTNCICEGTIYGLASGTGDSAKYYFEGYIYNTDENHTYTDNDKAPDSYGYPKQLIGGRITNTVIVTVNSTTTTYTTSGNTDPGYFGYTTITTS